MTNPFNGNASKGAKAASAALASPGDADKPGDPVDPFATPTGSSGERVSDLNGHLLVIKPTEIIDRMSTSKGEAFDVVRADVAVLDDDEEPGRVATGVLFFQQVLKAELARVLRGPSPYLLARLSLGATTTGNTLYSFLEASPEDRALAVQFIKSRADNPL